ncbi:MAG: hypothetical protein PHD01_07320 [Geobacteraceae bacterium]|nr:hypothetical protein [Geobacteraceae bacterium]
MKIFGYQSSQVNDDGLFEMKEITFCGKPEQLRLVADFLQSAADVIEANPGKYNHDHISFNKAGWDDEYPEVVVAEVED